MSFLAASALAPVAAPAIGASAELTAALNQIGGMGSNYLTDVLTDTAERMRRRPGGSQDLTPEQWRDALAEVLEARMSGSDEQARQLRAEVGRVLQSIDAVAVALAASADTAEEVRDWLTEAIRALGAEVEELRWVQTALAQALAGVQVELATQSIQQREQMDLTRRSLLTVTAMRAEILDSIAAAVTASGGPPTRRQPAGGGTGEVCPFPGPASFGVEDAEWFVGRELLVAELLGRLAEDRAGTGPLVLVGVSGVGKTSVLQAGLLPAISRGELAVPGSQTWPWITITPGAKPLTVLAARTAGLAGVNPLDAIEDLRRAPEEFGALAAQAARAVPGDERRNPDSARLVIVVDQFEELFTQDVDAAERAAFVTALTSAAPALVVLAVRADFYPQCIRLEPLASVLPDRQVVIGPLRVDDLRRVVLQPAGRAGLEVEPALVELLLADLGAQADGGYEPGALPLLAYALRETWERRDGRTLTVTGYQQAGGIANAVAAAAESIYQELDEAGQEALRAALLRTVAVGPPETGLMRRKARQEDIDPVVLARLVTARLVTADEDGVEISHEALLYAWPRLTEWLADDRQGLQLHRQLDQATRDWIESGEDENLLYRGARLVAVREWVAGRNDLTGSEQRFIEASTAVAEQAIRLERHRTRRLRQLVAVMVVLLLAAITGLAGAFVARDNERERAAEALSRQFAAESGVAANSDLRRSMALAALAWDTSRTAEARGALLSAQMLQHAGQMDDPEGELSVAISGNGRWVATGAGDGAVRLWDGATHRQRHLLRGHAKGVYQTAFSPDSKLLATAAVELPGIRIWDVASGRLLHTLNGLQAVSWLPDGQDLIGLGIGPVDSNWELVVWDAATGTERSRTTVGDQLLAALSVSPDGERVALGHATGIVELWRLRDPERLAVLERQAEAPETPAAVAFAPDGTLATGTVDYGQVQFWDGTTGVRLGATTDSPRRPGVTSLAYTPDGRNLIVAGGSPSAHAWNIAEKAWISDFFGQTGNTIAVAVSGDGRFVAGAGVGQRTILWRLADNWYNAGETQALIAVSHDPRGRHVAFGGVSGLVLVQDLAADTWRSLGRHSRQINSLAYARDGTLASASDDGTVKVFDPSGKLRRTLSRTGFAIDEMAVSPDGSLLVVAAGPPRGRDPGAGTTAKGFTVYDVKTLEPVHSVNLGQDSPSALEFTPDGSRLVLLATRNVTEGNLRTQALVRIWRTQDLRERRINAEREFELGTGTLVGADLSPDGRTLAIGGADRQVQLWDLASGRKTGSLGGQPGTIRAVAYSPDGRRIATINTRDYLIRVWDVPTRSLLANLSGHVAGVNDVEFAPDGSTLASAAVNGFVAVWNLRPDRALARICQSLAGAGLNAEWRELGVDPAEAPCR